MFTLTRFLFILATVASFAAEPLPSPLQKSEVSNIFRNGVSSQLDPLLVGDYTLAGGDVSLVAKDLVFTGFKDSILDTFSFNFETNISTISFHSDITIKCFYEFNGLLFSRPVYGEGDFTGLFEDLKFSMVMPFEIKEDENSRQYIYLKSYYSLFDVTDNGKIVYEGLYNGDKQLSDEMHSLIHEHYRVYSFQIGYPFYNQAIGKLFEIFRENVQALPLKDGRC